GARVQERRSTDLRALADLDLLAEADAPVAAEMDGQRSRSRARRWILGHAAAGGKHARLPAPTGSGEAAGGGRPELGEGAHVRRERRHLLLALELHEDVQR